jgi:tRNA pseudouridine55 synthase
MNGILNINKPLNKTSFSIVAMVRQWTGEKHVGHAGTLDPMATGVLPVCIGQATRLVEYLMDTSKTYQAEIEFGITTDTYDMEGKVTERTDISGITRQQVETSLDSFRGLITQTPPMYSAVKHHGRPLYELARAGVVVERKSRSAMIYSIDLIDWQPPLATVKVVCGKGTYIRSLAHDLGQMLACGASLRSLVRLNCGIFDIANAVTPDELKEACDAGYWGKLLYPIDSILAHWQAVVVGQETEHLIRSGTMIAMAGGRPNGEFCRAYTQCGILLGILQFDIETGMWHPDKVFM